MSIAVLDAGEWNLRADQFGLASMSMSPHKRVNFLSLGIDSRL